MPHEPANTSSAAQPTKCTGTVASRRRVSGDGGEYTYAEFVEFFGPRIELNAGSVLSAAFLLIAMRTRTQSLLSSLVPKMQPNIEAVLLFPKMLHPTRLAHRPQQT